MSLPKLKKVFVSETCLRYCAIDLQISFLALAIASKKIIQNRQWNSRKVVTIWRSQWNLGFSYIFIVTPIVGAAMGPPMLVDPTLVQIVGSQLPSCQKNLNTQSLR